MKTIRLVSMALIGLAITLGSCSGSDGETGPQGKQGVAGLDGSDGSDGSDGISCWDLNGNGAGDADEDINNDGNFDALDCQGSDGADGADGTNGVDGNANVQQFAYDITLFGDYGNLTLDLLNIVDQPSNYAFLYYIVDFDGLTYSIPGPLYNEYYTTVYTDVGSGGNSFYIDFFNTPDNTVAVVPNGLFTQVIVVAMELTNGAKNSESLIADLKDAGVDTSDYNAVANYFGLE